MAIKASLMRLVFYMAAVFVLFFPLPSSSSFLRLDLSPLPFLIGCLYSKKEKTFPQCFYLPSSSLSHSLSLTCAA